MVVLDEKQAQIVPGNAPPPYPGLPSAPPPGGDGAKVGAANYEIDTDSTLPAFPNAPLAPATFSILPSNILLYIVHLTLPENNWSTKWKIARTQESLVERKRKVLYWMMICLRCVNRALYVPCMHVLRSTYLPAYTSMIRQPYSSDPFPLASPSPAYNSTSTTCAPAYSSQPPYMVSPVNAVQRETAVLDLYLAAKVHEDVWADDTELHLEREEAFSDLFELMQPRARLEDLVREYGVAANVIAFSASGNAVVASCASLASPISTSFHSPHSPSIAKFPSASPSSPVFPNSPGGPSNSNSTSTTRGSNTMARRLPFRALSCSFSPRTAGIVYTTRSTKRTIVEVPRSRDERLEIAAQRLVRGLKSWIAENYL